MGTPPQSAPLHGSRVPEIDPDSVSLIQRAMRKLSHCSDTAIKDSVPIIYCTEEVKMRFCSPQYFVWVLPDAKPTMSPHHPPIQSSGRISSLDKQKDYFTRGHFLLHKILCSLFFVLGKWKCLLNSHSEQLLFLCGLSIRVLCPWERAMSMASAFTLSIETLWLLLLSGIATTEESTG